MSRISRFSVVFLATSLAAGASVAEDVRTATLSIRGHDQVLRLYGPREGVPIVVSSGDGGWIHLGPHVAEVLADRGFFVVGFDVRAYLSSFTSGSTGLRAEDVAGDYRTLVAFAARRPGDRVVLVGVSEGAALSVLAAAEPATKRVIGGVIGLGLGDVNELAWRWRDAVTYITKGTPREPTFSAAAVVDRIAPIPLAEIHSTHDEYVPLAEAQAIMDRAGEPKRLSLVDASNHRFSSNLPGFDRCLLETLQWIESHRH